MSGLHGCYFRTLVSITWDGGAGKRTKETARKKRRVGVQVDESKEDERTKEKKVGKKR